MEGALNGRQQALLELLKVTHHPQKDHRVNLEVAEFYLDAVMRQGDGAQAPKPAKPKAT